MSQGKGNLGSSCLLTLKCTPGGRATKDQTLRALGHSSGNCLGYMTELKTARSQPSAAFVVDTQPVVAGSKGCHWPSMEADQARGNDVGFPPWGNLHFIPGKADKLVQKETHT